MTYQLQNFISDIGGLSGLFLGFSLISFFELLLKAATLGINWIISKFKSFTARRNEITLKETQSGNEHVSIEVPPSLLFETQEYSRYLNKNEKGIVNHRERLFIEDLENRIFGSRMTGN